MGTTPSITAIYGKNDKGRRVITGYKEAGNPISYPVGKDGKIDRGIVKKAKIVIESKKETPKKFSFGKSKRR